MGIPLWLSASGAQTVEAKVDGLYLSAVRVSPRVVESGLGFQFFLRKVSLRKSN